MTDNSQQLQLIEHTESDLTELLNRRSQDIDIGINDGADRYTIEFKFPPGSIMYDNTIDETGEIFSTLPWPLNGKAIAELIH